MAITLQHPRSYYGGFLSHGGTPKSSISIGCSWIFHYKPSIFGYPYIVDLFMICIFIYHLNLYLSYNIYWLVVSTPLKNISQLGLFFPIYGKIKNVPNHQPDKVSHQRLTGWRHRITEDLWGPWNDDLAGSYRKKPHFYVSGSLRHWQILLILTHWTMVEASFVVIKPDKKQLTTALLVVFSNFVPKPKHLPFRCGIFLIARPLAHRKKPIMSRQ